MLLNAQWAHWRASNPDHPHPPAAMWSPSARIGLRESLEIVPWPYSTRFNANIHLPEPVRVMAGIKTIPWMVLVLLPVRRQKTERDGSRTTSPKIGGSRWDFKKSAGHNGLGGKNLCAGNVGVSRKPSQTRQEGQISSRAGQNLLRPATQRVPPVKQAQYPPPIF